MKQEYIFKNLEKLELEIGYKFKNRKLLEKALTHPSTCLENKLKSNQRLEFLGDAVFDLAVATVLYKMLPDMEEGELTKIRASLVCEGGLYEVAEKIKLGDYFYTEKDGKILKTAGRKSILADGVEAVAAAIYLDCGEKLDKPLEFITRFIPEKEELLKDRYVLKDYKTILQEIIQKNPEEKIVYEITDQIGPAHDRYFKAAVTLNGQYIGRGDGRSKKSAEQEAAKEALLLFGVN